MLHELARPEVAEFAVVSDRLPCVKVAGKYEPIDKSARTTEQILELLVAAGGSRYVEDMATRPAAWTMRLDGVGSVGVQAVEREGRRAGAVHPREARVQRVAPGAAKGSSKPPARKSMAPGRKSIPAMRATQRPGKLSRPPAPARKTTRSSKAPPRIEEHDIPEALRHAAVLQPVTIRPALGPLGRDPRLRAAAVGAASDAHVVAERPVMLRIAGSSWRADRPSPTPRWSR